MSDKTTSNNFYAKEIKKRMKRFCPFCKAPNEMIRPRNGMIRAVNYGLQQSEYIISDEPLFKVTSKNMEMSYNDYICPNCKVVLLYND